MKLYDGTIESFHGEVLQNTIADTIATNYQDYYRKRPAPSEYRSWRESLNYLNNAFQFSRLMDNEIVIEYELPYSSRRIDVLVFGRNKSKKDGVVLIELKQWSNDNVEDCETEGNVKVNYGRFVKEQAHPSLQVEGYHCDLKDFHILFHDESVVLDSCVYCHNYSRGDKEVLFQKKFNKLLDSFPIFSKQDAEGLGEYLRDRLSGGAGMEVFSRFINSPIRPSRKLLDHTKDMIHKQQIFNLIDDQIAAYNSIMHKAKQLAKLKSKSIIIIKGGPGTGKSVIALEVMGELMRQGKMVFHATGSSAFTNTLRQIVGIRANRLFKFFNSFASIKENTIDVLICDEAHRIRETSSNRYTPRHLRSDDPQIDELIRVAKLVVFFIDEYQVVRPNEIGSVKLIKDTARKFGISEENIAEFELKTQFRCSGSDAYLQWLDHVLGIRESELVKFDSKMEFKIFDDAGVMYKEIKKRNQEKSNSARIVAGFSWPWSNPNLDGTLVRDVVIGDFSMPWERKDEFWKWATKDAGMDQVGTVYTSQGFEFDYIGVIFSNDLVYDPKTKQWESIPDNSYDSMITRNNKDLTKHLQHVYRVLLSRAHKGVYICFIDKDTKNYFRSNLPRA